jgi:hypothetical protein
MGVGGTALSPEFRAIRRGRGVVCLDSTAQVKREVQSGVGKAQVLVENCRSLRVRHHHKPIVKADIGSATKTRTI